MATALAYDPDLGGKGNQMTDLYDYYGYLACWAPGFSLRPGGYFR